MKFSKQSNTSVTTGGLSASWCGNGAPRQRRVAVTDPSADNGAHGTERGGLLYFQNNNEVGGCEPTDLNNTGA